MATEKNCADIGRRLQRERESLGYSSQEKLGEKLQRSKRTITNWESGDSFPNASDLLELDALGVDVLYVVTGQRNFQAAKSPDLRSTYLSPARRVAGEIAGMDIGVDDAELLLSLAQRLDIPR